MLWRLWKLLKRWKFCAFAGFGVSEALDVEALQDFALEAFGALEALEAFALGA